MAHKHETREAWLNFVARGMGPAFAGLDAPLPDRVRIAIGFTSTGQRSKRIGECWDNRCSEDGHFEIFIRPDLAEGQDVMPLEIAAILGHELVHAAVGIPAGHGKDFRRVAKGIGLIGPMRSTTAGPEFRALIQPILDAAGPLPHARLMSGIGEDDGSSTRPKKQSKRHIKCTCLECGYVVRTARKWLDEIGKPHCPKHGEMTVEDTGEPEEDEDSGDE